MEKLTETIQNYMKNTREPRHSKAHLLWEDTQTTWSGLQKLAQERNQERQRALAPSASSSMPS